MVVLILVIGVVATWHYIHLIVLSVQAWRKEKKHEEDA